MQPRPQTAGVKKFGFFELDLAAGELRKRGRKIKLPDQPLQVLVLLLQRPGEVVSREELREALWPSGTFVDFEHGLNTAIKTVRHALGDSADNPRFIETLPRKGYRFIAPVDVVTDQAKVRPRKLLPSLLGAATLVAILATGAAWLWNKRHIPQDAQLTPVPLTAYPGRERCPNFSPDGTQVAFHWCPGHVGADCDIYIKQIGVETPFRLTDNPAREYTPAWSPDGQTIAFIRDISPTQVALVLVPHRKGPERVLVEFPEFTRRNQILGPFLDWTPDSKWIVSVGLEDGQLGTSLFLLSADTGEKRRLTTSPATTRNGGDTCPAVSRDGRTLAFIRRGIGPWTGLYLLRLGHDYVPQGEPERITSDVWNNGVAWTPDGREIVFSGGQGLSAGLMRIAASKSATPRRLSFGAHRDFGAAVSRQGNRLAYMAEIWGTNIWRVTLNGPGAKVAKPVRFIASTRWELAPAYSPDGSRIAFLSDRSGTMEVWASDRDGLNPVKLTSLGGGGLMGPRWSPDGQSIAFTTFLAGNAGIHVLNLKGCAARPLTSHRTNDKWPYWSRDGRSLYFCSTRTGEPGEIWKMPSTGGEAVQITRKGGDFPQESPDGRFVYYEKGWPLQPSVWRVPVEGGEEVKILDSVHPAGKWVAGKEGVYYFTAVDERKHTEIRLYSFATGKSRKILPIESSVDDYIAVSPDGRTILYAQFDEADTDLMLVENFR